MNNLSDEVLTTAKLYAAEVGRKDDAMYILDLVTFAAELLQQNFCKPGVVGCKELLEPMMHKEQMLYMQNENDKEAIQHLHKVASIETVIKMLDELPAL